MAPRVFVRFDTDGTPLAPLSKRANVVRRMLYTLHFQPEEKGGGSPRRRMGGPPRPTPNKPPAAPRPTPPPPATATAADRIGMLSADHRRQLAFSISKVVARPTSDVLRMFDKPHIASLPIGVYAKGRGAFQIRPRFRDKSSQNAWYRKHFGP